MIYLFDESKTLTGTVRDEHVRSLLYDREKDGLYEIRAEIPVINYYQGERYNLHEKTKDAVFIGHYDLEGQFQLHKIAGYDVNSDSIAIAGVHLFFDEAKAGAIIKDRRYINREVSDGARDAFNTIGWQMADFDVSPTRTYNFYNVSPLEARSILIETFGFEFKFWLDFDGKKISGKYFSVKKQIGQDNGKRYTYDKHTNTGNHVLSLTAETDYSEVYTAVIGRGRGEEIADTGGYGRRIEYTDIEWSKPNRPLDKPLGSRVLIDPEATQAFGYVQEDGTITPRTAVVEFSDIEVQSELLEASYDWLVEHRQPKLVFDVNVADGDGLELGDTVYIKYNEIGLNMAVRVGKVIDDLKSGERQVQLGDVAYFKPGRSNRDIKRSIRQERRDASNRIYQLKLEFDDRFDNTVNQIRDDYEQALIDANAEIQAAEQRMETLINTTRNDWTDTFEAEVAEIYRTAQEEYDLINQQIIDEIDTNRTEIEENFDAEVAEAYRIAQENYDAIDQRITSEIVTTRTDLQEEFDSKVADSREYADSQIADKEAQYEADWNQRDADIQQSIETVVGGSVDALDTNLLDVNSRLFQTRNDLIERINNIDTQSFNLIRGSRFDEADRYATSGGTVHDDEDMPYFRYGISSGNIQYISTVDDIQFEADKTYTLSLDYRTSSDVSIDYLRIISTDGSTDINIRNNITESDMAGIIPDGEWHRTFLTFTVPRNLTGNLRLGSDFTSGTKAQIDIRLPYLTTSGNTQWVFHPSDSYESIMSIMTRLDEFESQIENDLAGVSGELSSAREALQEQLDDARSELEGLDYENRNLVVYSDGFTSYNPYNSTPIVDGYDLETTINRTGDTNIALRSVSFLAIQKPNAFYTVSGYFYLNGDPIPDDFFVGGFHNSYRMIVHSLDISDDGYVVAVLETSGNPHDYLIQTEVKADVGDVLSIDYLKVEKGKKVTPFSEAPEDTEQKITTLNEQIEYIDGQLEAKLEQTDIEPINNKITEYGNSLTANAQSIESLISKTELHDGDITEWSNQTTANAEELTRTLSRLSDTEIGLESAQHTLSETADGLERTISRVSETESGLEDAQLAIEANADAFKLTVSKDEFEGVTAGLEGRNLFVTSEGVHTHNPYSSLNEVTDSGFTTTANNENGGHNLSARISSFLPSQLSAGEKYTVSGYMYVNGEPIDSEFLNTLHSSSSLSSVGAVINDDGFFYETFEVIRSNQSYLLQAITSAEIGDVIEVRKLMVTRGNAVLDYQPAQEDTASRITQLNTDISIEAGRINALLTRTSETEQSIADIDITVDGITSDFANYKENVDGEVGALSAQVASYEASVDGFRAEVGTLQGDIDDVDTWIADKGSVIEGTADAISARVWKDDIDDSIIGVEGRNLISGTSVDETDYNFSGYNADIGKVTPLGMSELRKGGTFTISVDITESENNGAPGIGVILQVYVNGTLRQFNSVSTPSARLNAGETGTIVYTFNVPSDDYDDNSGNVRLRNRSTYSGNNIGKFACGRLHLGSKSLSYAPAPEDFLQHTDFILESDGFFLGGKYVGGDHYSTAIVGSKDGIDILAERMRVTGDLIVKGDVEAWSMAAVKAEFGSLWADEFSAITIDADDINGLTARFEWLYTLNANIEKLVAQHVFADGVNALVGNFVEVNAGSIVTSGLSANVITADHIDTSTLNFSMISGTDALIERLVARSAFVDAIQGRELTFSDGTIGRLESSIIRANVIKTSHLDVDTTMVRKLFATTARIDQLITRNHYVDNVKTLSIDAVHADLRSVNSEIMTSNIIKADWLDVDTALFERFTASEAFIDRLEVKAGNIRDLTGTHIRGGLLDSLNGATRLNLNTGDWTIGGSAKITFTSRNNRLEYSNRGITGGMQFDHSLGSDGRPMTAVGVSDGAFDVNDDTYRGLIVHSLGTEGLLGYGTSLITQSGGFYTRTDRTGSGINFRLHATGSGAPRGIYPQYTGTYDYNLGSALNPWAQAYIRDIRTSGELWIRDWNGSGGWKVNTMADSGSSLIVLRGVNTGSWNYNLGSTTYRINAIYLRNSPNVSSDERLKEDIKPSDLGLDFINGIEIKSFRKKMKDADINEGKLKNHVEFGLIAQQLRDNLISHNVDVEDIAMVSIDDDGYYGVQHEQLIAPTIKAVQDLDVKVESNTEKIARLEKEIETLKGA